MRKFDVSTHVTGDRNANHVFSRLDTKQRFEKHRSELTRSDLVVIEHLLSMPVEEMIFQNAEDIASKSGTSDAMFIRAA
ncbi:hypothetical protein [Ochrobactrum quorumnocens]|uniref:hypothetical protein n=1 Tax=Ochrobactrum quorumnocens TaxID=271865 RepID=UPI000AC7801F|nr:hypothetical protein [[Ochrobactrum] quorumnocens]